MNVTGTFTVETSDDPAFVAGDSVSLTLDGSLVATSVTVTTTTVEVTTEAPVAVPTAVADTSGATGGGETAPAAVEPPETA